MVPCWILLFSDVLNNIEELKNNITVGELAISLGNSSALFTTASAFLVIAVFRSNSLHEPPHLGRFEPLLRIKREFCIGIDSGIMLIFMLN